VDINPMGLRAAYERDAQELAAPEGTTTLLGERDVAQLPAAVQRYLHVAGAIGRPRVRRVRARLHGRIRRGATSRWMPLVAEQLNIVEPSARLFCFRASMFGVPVVGYHRYVGASATMRVRAAGVIPLVNAGGDEMAQSETVTLFNDMCVLAPATLIDRRIDWLTVDSHTSEAAFTNAGHTIRATLSFNDAGELVDFHSDDRYKADGNSFVRAHWSTPLRDYRTGASGHLASCGEARWRDQASEFAYIELTFDDVRYNAAAAVTGVRTSASRQTAR
jgi:hypothetical protein